MAFLSSLLAPASETALVEAFVAKRRLHVVSPDARRAEALLPAWLADRLVASDALGEGALEVLRAGDVVPPGQFRASDGRLRKDALDALIAEGVSLLLHRIDDEVPAIARVSDAIERRLGHTVWANAYITHGPGGALAPHYDDHDVLVVQVRGAKRWFGHGTPELSPVVRSPAGRELGPTTWELALAPGDVLYLPRGEVHHTANVGSLSVHLTFGVDARRGVELLAPLRERAVQERLFREDLTRLAGDEALRERAVQLKARLHALVDAIDVEAFLTEDDRARPLRCLAGLGGAEVAARAPATSFVVSAVRRRLAIHADGDHGDERVLDAGARTFRLSRGAVGVLEVLATLERPTLADLAGALGVGEDEARRSVVELAGHGLVGVEWAF
ncbi:MAG: hypothetical protein IPF92_03920 [Myxococcales bacterium]|nr:hypothetical protein [Myxococcales bacterium]